MRIERPVKVVGVLALISVITIGFLLFYNQESIHVFGDQEIEPLWNEKIDGGFGSGPAIGDLDGDGKTEVVIGGLDGVVYAFHAENGEILWSIDIGVSVEKSPTLSDLNNDENIDVIVTGTDNSITALNGPDGSIMWALYRSSLDVTGHLSDNHESDYYTLNVNEIGATFEATLLCYGNDFDLYGKLNAAPTTSNYDWRGYASGDEELTIEDINEGTWHIMVHQYSGTGNYHLIVDVIYRGDTEETSHQFSGTLDSEDDTETYQISVPYNAVEMHCVLSCGANDFDLYGRLESQPTTDIYDWRGFASGDEDLIIEYPDAGTWYIMVHSYSGSGGYRLKIDVTYTIDMGSSTSSIMTGDITTIDTNGDNIPEVISGTRSNRLEVLNGLDGSLEQVLTLGSSPQGGIAVADLDGDDIWDFVSATSNHRLIAVNGSDGSVLWNMDTVDNVVGSPVIVDINQDENLDIVIALESGLCKALAGDTGEQIWRSTSYQPAESGISLGDVDKDGIVDIIVGYSNGEIYAYNGETGTKIWEYQASGSIQYECTIADIDGDKDLDVIGSSEGNELFALDGKTGTELWRIQTPSRITGAPAIGDLDDDFLIEIAFACEGGQLYSMDVNGSGHRIYWQGQSGTPSFSRSFSQVILDQDLDLLSTYSETRLFSNPYSNDSDSDSLLDGWEYSNGLSPTSEDSDFDDLDDKDEIQLYGTDPTNFDTDQDRLSDYKEIMTYFTNPLNADTDQDLLFDADELLIYGSDPFIRDSDGDTIEDGAEVHQYGSHPMLVDTDRDGLSDQEEIEIYHTWANSSDSDQDGLGDLDEIFIYGSDPTNPDSDQDGALDGIEIHELRTDLLNWDTDGDAAPDGWEASFGFDPLDYNVPIEEMLLFNFPIIVIGIGILISGIVILRVRRKDSEVIDDVQDLTSRKEEKKASQTFTYVFQAEDGVEKPWLMDGKESLLREGDVHDFMQWLVQEERRIEQLEGGQEFRKALRLARLLLEYVHQEKDLICTAGPRTYSDAVRRLEGKINHLLVRM
ncbi:MAG: hypothetical protein BAJATHORv1_40241 [Candidatus Thorarchaeota archaeon]|nr:MAG: hypothetical protein BAJATHORv1_40241 [Candidatus Thorarchaeota archaeon]